MTDPEAATSHRTVAAFDFDGTLSRRDTLIPFLALAAGRGRFLTACSKLGLLGARGRVPLRDRDAMKAELISMLFAGRAEEPLRALGERYSRDLLAKQLRPDVLRRLVQHLEAGHHTVFVSASLVYYLEPLAHALGVHEVIAVEPAVSDGVLTGALARPNVRAEQKAVRLREHLGLPQGAPADDVELWSYGNSSGDHELLEMADHAVWLGPARKRPRAAQEFRADPRPF